jgi:hypothetical protein
MKRWLIRAWLVIGLALFAYVLTRTPVSQIADAVAQMGVLVIISPMIASLWFATRAKALQIVVGGTVPWRVLYALRWIGDGYNGVLPLAGVGGEPFKLRILDRYMPVEAALAGLVRDRLIDNGLGFIVSGGFAATGLALLAVPAPGHSGFYVYAAIAVPLGILLIALMVSRLPGQLGAFAGRVLAGHRDEPAPLARAVVVRSLGWFAITRGLQACETALLLHLIDAPSDLASVLFVDGALNAAGFIGFLMPQGLGVVEGAAVFMLTGLGVAPAAATAFALVRRARVVACGVIAIGVHAASGARARVAAR